MNFVNFRVLEMMPLQAQLAAKESVDGHASRR
jgi:hypothetical protein